MEIRAAERLRDAAERAYDLTWEARRKASAWAAGALKPSDLPRDHFTRIQWPRRYDSHLAPQWVEGIRGALGQRVELKQSDLPQRFNCVVCFQLKRGGEWHQVALDYADKSEIHAACAERSLLYLKMQFRREGYPLRNVIPAGYVTANVQAYRYLPPVRALRDRRRFRWDVSARFGLRFAADLRTRAVELLSAQRHLRFHGGTRLVRYSRYLREIAQSKVCVDLPGNGSFCFRLVEYLAVGACVVAVRHENRLPVDLVDDEHLVWVRPDLSDLVERCEELVRDDARRERIALNARRYFDAYLHQQALADYYLERCYAALRGEDVGAPPPPSPGAISARL